MNDELLRTLAAIKHTLDSRIEVWRTVVDADGHVVKRIYCGANTATPRASRTSEPQQEDK